MASVIAYPQSEVAVDYAGGTIVWNSETNCTGADDTVYDTATVTTGSITEYLRVYNFDFSSIPVGSTLNGIKVNISRKGSAILNGGIYDDVIRLTDSSIALVGDNKADGATIWPTADTIKTYGGETDTWNSGMDISDILSSNFSVYLACQNTHASLTRTASVDSFAVTIYYTAPTGAAPTDSDANRTRAIYLDSSKNIGSDLDLAKSQYLKSWDFTSTDKVRAVRQKTKDFGS